MIYLDHAATTPLCDEALEAMLPFFKEQYANISSSYAAARQVRTAVDAAKAQVAKLIGASPQEIYITSGGTEADNWALLGIMHAAPPGKRHLITSSIEHHAVLKTCKALEDEEYSVTYVPVSRNGIIDLDAVERAITPQTGLISVMLANNEVGTLQPIREISALAHRHGVLMHTDAVQAVGHIKVDVCDLDVDLLSLSAHKFYGPKGVGALYIRSGTRIDRLIHGGEQERGLRAGTENTAGIIGMGKAAELAAASLEIDYAHVIGLRDQMINLVHNEIPGVRINGIDAPRLPGHVHMTINDADSSLLLMQLDMLSIAASAGSACASGAAERSHVMAAMGIRADHQADLRFSLGRQNTLEDIIKTISALKRILDR